MLFDRTETERPSVQKLVEAHKKAIVGKDKLYPNETAFREMLDRVCDAFGEPHIDTEHYQSLNPRQVTILAGMLELKDRMEIIRLTYAARPQKRRGLFEQAPSVEEREAAVTRAKQRFEANDHLGIKDVRKKIQDLAAASKRAEEHHEARVEEEKQLRQELRSHDRPAFKQIVEEVYREKLRDTEDKINLKTLLWDRVFPAWHTDGKPLSPERFSQMIARKNPGDEGRTTLSNSLIYQWKNHPDMHPYQESITILCKAFGLDQAHETMLWKISCGTSFKNPYPRRGRGRQGAQAEGSELDAAIAAAEATQNHGPLVRALTKASGYPSVRLRDLLESQQLIAWQHGAVIEKTETADRFLELTNPPSHADDPQATRAQNARIRSLLTGRIFDIPAMLETVRKSGTDNPGGALLLLLTGRRGLVPLSREELAEKMTHAGCPITAEKAKKIRSSNYQKGASISAAQAGAIMDVVGSEAHLRISEKLRRECIDMLTSNPISMAAGERAEHEGGFRARVRSGQGSGRSK